MTALKILTWNIWMMPLWFSPDNDARAAAIGDELLKHDFDILCLEKAFTESARSVLEKKLGERYPYRYGPVNISKFPSERNGGVWVLSRIELTGYREIEFGDLTISERLARKGAMLLNGKIDGHDFHLIATHLQGDDGAFYDEGKQKIRGAEMKMIADELIAKHTRKDIPLFICGDLCTPRRDTYKPPSAETQPYTKMLETFGAENGPEDRITLDDNRSHNDVADDNKGRVAELDYILLRQGSTPIKGIWERMIFRHPGWDHKHGRQDLSYRYAVSGTFELT